MSVNDAPLARIRKSVSSSSADQIVELFGAPIRTISTPLPIFLRSDKSRIAIRQIMAAGIPKTTAYRLGTLRGARRIGSVTTVSPAGGASRRVWAAVKDAEMEDAGGRPQPTLCANARPHQLQAVIDFNYVPTVNRAGGT
jgi:hypothetical protein